MIWYKLDRKIVDVGKKLGSDIVVIYFDLINEEVSLDKIYFLGIVIMY